MSDQDSKNKKDTQSQPDPLLPTWGLVLLILVVCGVFLYIIYHIFIKDTYYPQMEYGSESPY